MLQLYCGSYRVTNGPAADGPEERLAVLKRNAGLAGASHSIKQWVTELLELAEHERVMVSELACHEPGCPPIETVVVVLRGPGDTVMRKFHRRAHDLTRAEIEAAWAQATSE